MIKKIIFTLSLTLAATFLPLTLSPSTVSVEPARAQAFTIGRSTVVTRALLKQDPKTGWVFTIYNLAKGFVNVIAFAILILVAMSNILHLKLDTYSVKKMLLPILTTVAAANLAIPIITLVSSFVDSMQTVSIMRPASAGMDYIMLTGAGFKSMSVWALIGLIATLIASAFSVVTCVIGALIVMSAWIITFLLNVVLSFRPYVILLAAAVSPLAIMCSILPQTQSFFKRWMGIIVPWMFMPLAVNALINAGRMIPADMGITGTGAVATLVGWFLPALLRMGILILALRFPFTVDKDIAGLIQKAGGAAAKAYPQLSGAGADYLFKRNKANSERNYNRALNQSVQTQNANRPTLLAAKEAQLRTENPSLQGQALRDAAEGQVNRDILRQARQDATTAKNAYESTTGARALKLGAGALALPLSIQVSIKQAREVNTKEREKTASKVAGNALREIGIGDNSLDSMLRESGGRFGRLVADSMGGAGMRTKLGDLKYWEAIQEGDLSQLDSAGIEAAIRGAMRSVKRNAAASDDPNFRANPGQAAVTVLNGLHERQESVGTWADNELLRGMSNSDIATLKIGWGKLRQAQMREAAGWGGMGRQAQREAQVDRSMYQFVQGASGSIRGVDGDDDGGQSEEVVQSDPKVTSYLEKIARQSEQLSGISGIKNAIATAESSGIDASHAGQIESQSDETLGKIETRLKQMGLGDASTQRIIGGLKNTGALEIGTLIPKIKAEVKDAAAGSLIDSYGKTKVAHIGALANSDDARSVQRYAVEVVPKLSQQGIAELKGACETAMQYQLKINPEISPAQFQEAAKTVGKYIPEAVMKVKAADGTESHEISATAAAKIGRAVEAGTTQDKKR